MIPDAGQTTLNVWGFLKEYKADQPYRFRSKASSHSAWPDLTKEGCIFLKHGKNESTIQFDASGKWQCITGETDVWGPKIASLITAVQKKKPSIQGKTQEKTLAESDQSSKIVQPINTHSIQQIFRYLENTSNEFYEKAAEENKEYYDSKAVSIHFSIKCIKKTSIGNGLHANKIAFTDTKYSLVAASKLLQGEQVDAFWLYAATASKKLVVFDLTQLQELISAYCPLSDKTLESSEKSKVKFSVSEKTKTKLEDFDYFEYSMTLADTEKKPVTVERYRYTSWRDATALTPDNFSQKSGSDQELLLREAVEKLKRLVAKVKEFKECDIWIHCSAGVGRTGTLVVALLIDEMFENGKAQDKPPLELLNSSILEVRNSRYHAVFTVEQYHLLLRFIVDAMTNSKRI